MKAILFYILLFSSFNTIAQKRNDNWVFGDSAGINFSNPQNPVNFRSAVKSRGSSACISDTSGNLLFYYAYDPKGNLGISSFKNGNIYNRNNVIMVNGDSIVTGAWYLEGVIINNPSLTDKYYLFTIGVTGNFGLYYSTIDMTQDSGRGAVISKNVKLQAAKSTDCVTAIKHGNGRDWWVFYRRWDNANNDFYTYLVSPAGITLHAVQSVGTPSSNGFFTMTFSPDGTKLAVKTYTGLLELFDFDRCSGIISNPVTLETETPSPFPGFWDCEFSPNGNLLYVVISEDTSYLLQYNLLATNPSQTRDTIYTITYPTYSGGFLKLAPDNKIYWSCSWYDGFNWNFPYPDTTYNAYNSSLSVINAPDSLGAACNFTPYSFYLGGSRCYLGLPNNPDYDMPRLQGSPCDTVVWTSINEQLIIDNGQLFVSYVSDWQKLFVNAQNIKGKNCLLKVFDLNGRIVFSSASKTQPPYFTQNVDVSTLSNGIYIVSLTTEKEVLNKKFIKN